MEERIKDLLEEKNYKILKTELANMNSSDIAEILSDFDTKEIVKLFRLLKKDVAVEVFGLFDTTISTEVLNYLSDKEAVELIKCIKPSVVIPIHYHTIVGTVEDAYKFKRLLEGITDVKILMGGRHD